jgi:prefoldin subunit 1
VHEIEAQAILAQQDVNKVKLQIAAKQRDVRLLQLTSNEIRALPEDTKVYEGIGKM